MYFTGCWIYIVAAMDGGVFICLVSVCGKKNDHHVAGGICVVFSSMNGKKIIYMYYTLAPEGATPVYISLTDGEKNQIS